MQEPIDPDRETSPEDNPAGQVARHSDGLHVVAVGGLDPTGGAGLVRDLLTATALGARAVLVGTAWTIQDEQGVKGVEPRSPGMIQAALEHALAASPCGRTAVKVGMVANRAIVGAIVSGLREWPGPVVFDPVMGASGGGSLFEGSSVDLLPLMRRATVVTPNLAEAASLTGLTVQTLAQSRVAACVLFGLSQSAVLVKGGHLAGPATDVLRSSAGERLYEGPRLPGRSPRGTGCALATALAVGLSSGQALEEAVQSAKAWLAALIRSAVSIGEARHL
jgi:hydroxymethylpyrimidine/phosphomethylpyrimidine kinase